MFFPALTHMYLKQRRYYYTFFFLSPPSSKCLHRLIGSCLRNLHSVHSIFSTIFLVVFAFTANTTSAVPVNKCTHRHLLSGPWCDTSVPIRTTRTCIFLCENLHTEVKVKFQHHFLTKFQKNFGTFFGHKQLNTHSKRRLFLFMNITIE